MPQPNRYHPTHDFSDVTAANPPGYRLDDEFAAIEATTGQLCDNLALIQRDDGKLAADVVTVDSLTPGAIRALVADIPGAALDLKADKTVVDAAIVALGLKADQAAVDEVFAQKVDAAALLAPGGADLISLVALGAGAPTRSLQDKARDFRTARDDGAVGDGVTDDKLAFERANANGSSIWVTPGAYLLNTTPALTKPLEVMPGAVLTGAGAPGTGYTNTASRQTILAATVADQFALRYFRRHVTHTGGTPGYTASTVRIDTYVDANATDFQWGILSVLRNHATAGENTAAYFVGYRYSTGPTWGATIEVKDYVLNPTTGAIALEVDVTATGDDPNNARVGIDLAIRNNDPADPDAPVGGDCVVGWGYRIQNGGSAGAKVKVGYGFYTGMLADVCFDASLATSGIGLKLKANQAAVFSSDNTRKLYHNGGGLIIANGASTLFTFTDGGAIWIGANQVLGSRITGTPAAATDLATAITLANFLRSSGMAHGFIGT